MNRRSVLALTFSSAAYLALGGLGAAFLPAQAARGEADTLAIGGSVTEIVYALGQQHRLIARDENEGVILAQTHHPLAPARLGPHPLAHGQRVEELVGNQQ